jgi:transcriptional antiterminator RfaH
VKNWYAIYTKSRQEQLAEEHLRNQDYEVYLPRIRQGRTRVGRWRKVIEPLFPRYLFIKVNLSEDNTAPVRSTRGVTGLVRFDGEPVPVPDDFMAELMESCEDVEGMPVMGGAVLKEGDPVVILEGPFKGLAGILQGQTGEERVLVLLRILGRESSVAFDLDRLAPSR